MKKKPTRRTNLPKPRPPSIEQRLEDAEHLIAGQRADFDQLAAILAGRDEQAARNHQQLEATVSQLNRMTSLAYSLADRLGWYETRVPAIAQARKAYDAALRRKRADAAKAGAVGAEAPAPRTRPTKRPRPGASDSTRRMLADHKARDTPAEPNPA